MRPCGNWRPTKQAGLRHYNGSNKHESHASSHKKVCYLRVHCECANFSMVEVKLRRQSSIKSNYEVIHSPYLITSHDAQLHAEPSAEKS